MKTEEELITRIGPDIPADVVKAALLVERYAQKNMNGDGHNLWAMFGICSRRYQYMFEDILEAMKNAELKWNLHD